MNHPRPPRTHHGRKLEAEIAIDATPMDVWKAWTDPAMIARWFVDRAEGTAAPGQVMTWMWDTFNYRIPVPVLEAEPGHTFVTGSGDAPGPHGVPYLMEVTITRDAGSTVVHIVNSGFAEGDAADDEFQGVVSGWKMSLATLKHWLEKFRDRERQHRIFIEPASGTAESTAPWFRSPGTRAQWLAPDIADTGRVLCDSGREVLLDWPPRDAVLGLKAFAMGPQRVVALDVSVWSPNAVDEPPLEQSCRAALARLRTLAG